MKVGIDFTPAIYDRGVSRYTINLVRALLKKSAIELQLYGSSLRQQAALQEKAVAAGLTSKSLLKKQAHFQQIPPKVLSLLWRFGANPIKKHLPNIEVFHSWDWLQPPDKDLPLVSTIHDLAMLKYPATAHPAILKAHERSWKILQEREAEIITVSQATKKDIISLLNIPSFRIHVIPEALPTEIQATNQALTEERVETIKQRLQLQRPYMLFVGTREPRKNLQRLIEAWQPLKKDLELVVAGEKGWDNSSDKNQANLPGLRFLGKVTDEELNVLYAEAELFAYPSLDEGFGLPILEAFYHGTPVLTANVAALIEVAGNAAQLVDPQATKDIRQGIEKILNENAEQQRQRLQRMIIRMHMFSWHQVAEQTSEVYAKASQNHQ